jgi:hypothetical protein
MAMVNMKYMPTPTQEYTANFTMLNGGLNLSELEYRLKNNESPEMKNLLWREGVLCSRDGQEWVSSDDTLGFGWSMYDRLFWYNLVVHIGTGLYYLRPFDEEPQLTLLLSGVPENRGTWFTYYGSLYYKNRGGYYKIDYENGTLTAAAVVGYVPVTVINASPSNGSGDLYQPENRISGSKTVKYNAVADVKDYFLPVDSVDSVDKVVVDGATLVEGTGYTVDLALGKVVFAVAPRVTDPPTNNTVEITYTKANPDAYNSVMDCIYASTYGGSGELCIVMGGCPAQPNAIFWNGNNIAMDATYFPFSQYQFCGDTDDPVTGFGKQQSFLVVFKEHSIGRVKQDTQTIDGRVTIDMPYTAINAKIGCDLPYSIQLIDNNLVWCNTQQGVHFLKDSSYAYENNVEQISLKINGGPAKPGMLKSVREGVVSSADDEKRYWLCCGDEAWVWDYEHTTYKDPSWYYMTNIKARAFATELDDMWHLDQYGRLTHFVRRFNDYGEPIEKVYRFASQYFGGYDRLKNVNSVIIVTRPDTNSEAVLTYITDYETRRDLTNLVHLAWHLAPRNLSYRSLAGIGFGAVFRRRPMCRRVKHFTMKLEGRMYNDDGEKIIDEDLSIVSAQIFYNYQGRLR